MIFGAVLAGGIGSRMGKCRESQNSILTLQEKPINHSYIRKF
mgnify:CR=1 FL=1